MTKFSIAMGVGPREPMSRMAEISRAVEGHGFHALWIQDNPLITKDAYIALAVAALNTSSLLLAPGVSTPIIRHPSVIVNAISTLDNLADGRAVLGLGSGGPPLVKPLGSASMRIGDFRRTLEQIRTLMLGGEVVGPGSARYSVNCVHRHIPVYVAARGPLMLRATGELADGAVISATRDTDAIASKIYLLRQGTLAAQRDPGQVKVNLMLTVIFNDDPTPPQQHIQEGHGSSASSFGEAIFGDLGQCVQQLRSILRLKPDEVTFRLLTGGRMQRLEKLAALAVALKDEERL